jgi:hypothetical protein
MTMKTNMSERLKEELRNIAGDNVLGLRSKAVENLVLAVLYLAIQYKMAAKNAGYEEKEIEKVFETCCARLGVPNNEETHETKGREDR